MKDSFKSHTSGMRDPINSAAAVTPDDAADLAQVTRAIYVGETGDLRVTLISGEVAIFVAAGSGWHPIRVMRVWATGTTATGLLACS